MNFLKRCIAVLCALALFGNITLHISATEANNSSVGATNEVASCRIEDAYVDVSSFTNEDLYYVEVCIHEDQDGRFVIADDDSLRKNLTTEKYALVHEQITLCNEYTESTTFAATGTESNPYVLDPGVLATVVASGEFWFKCSIEGATDIATSSSLSSANIIYKKTLFGKTQLQSFTSTISNQTLNSLSQNSGTNTYFIRMKTSGSSTLKCRITQHYDSHYIPIGARWDMSSAGAVPMLENYTISRWYVPKENIENLVVFIENDDYLYYVDLVAEIGLSAASAAIGIKAPVLGAFLGFLGGHASSLTSGLISSAKQLADPDDDGTYENGVVLSKYYADGYVVYYVQTWLGGTMYGAHGQVGTWTNNNFEE